MTKVHTIGDSHCDFTFTSEGDSIFYLSDEGIINVPLTTHFVGSQTMYSFGIRGCDDKYFADMKEGDYLVFCFGEIDVRCHIDKQVTKEKRELDEVLSKLVEGYLLQIKKIAKKYKVIPVIFGVTPPVRELTVDGYPSVGPAEARVKYTKRLNAKLKKSKILYFDVFDEYSMADGTLKMKFSDGVMHIGKNYNQMAKDKLCALILRRL
ncbi:MAG: hypothetical protein SP4CHLAM5_03830 [Chlamydiia bacterium]|nr:hypothetical protein [Chlamydiia bacterium]MCH9618257.1 hypothetical protein [Chlamydiia bacterium]MCH9624653.1 hypothetical protein [Chlamydiia bacterium]